VPCELQESRGNAAAVAAAAVSDGFEQGQKGIDTFRFGRDDARAGPFPKILGCLSRGSRVETK